MRSLILTSSSLGYFIYKLIRWIMIVEKIEKIIMAIQAPTVPEVQSALSNLDT